MGPCRQSKSTSDQRRVGYSYDQDEHTAIQRTQLGESDVTSFHNYGWPEEFRAEVVALQKLGRPVVCTEYMARGAGSTFDTVLPIASEMHVAAINWGFVAGKTSISISPRTKFRPSNSSLLDNPGIRDPKSAAHLLHAFAAMMECSIGAPTTMPSPKARLPIKSDPPNKNGSARIVVTQIAESANTILSPAGVGRRIKLFGLSPNRGNSGKFLSLCRMVSVLVHRLARTLGVLTLVNVVQDCPDCNGPEHVENK